MIERGGLDAAAVRAAVTATFAARSTHAITASLPPPPARWAAEFSGMAREAELSTTDYRAAFAILDRYWRDNGLTAGGGTAQP